MKILTLNTQKAYQQGFNDFLVETLRKEEYDFILLQEATSPVLAIIGSIASRYVVHNTFDSELEGTSHECILYKDTFTLEKQLFLSFAILKPELPRYGWGFLGGAFARNEERVFVGSVHLHPGLKKKARMEQIFHIKEHILKEDGFSHIILGGDFNFGLPGEISRSDKMLSPEFRRVTKNIGPTLDSAYIEEIGWGVARVANTLMKLGISIKLPADQVYVNTAITENMKVFSKTLPDRISDHLAVEVEIS